VDEFELIRRIERVLGRSALPDSRVVLGIGDDAAILAPSCDRVVATTDSLVEGVHFRWALCSPVDVGYKAVTVNLSDLAAMGARPLGLLLSLCLSRPQDTARALGVARGVAVASRSYGVRVVGGNITAIDGPTVVTVTALGESSKDTRLVRSGALPGDRVMVSGRLGEAALGLAMLSRMPELASSHPRLARAYRRPEAAVALGLVLAARDGVHAVIDVSDGLLADLGHVLAASRVGARIDADALPVAPCARRFARKVGIDPIEAAMSGGDDYVLLACVAPDVVGELEGFGMIAIGSITTRKGRLEVRRDGRRFDTGCLGYRHFD